MLRPNIFEGVSCSNIVQILDSTNIIPIIMQVMISIFIFVTHNALFQLLMNLHQTKSE